MGGVETIAAAVRADLAARLPSQNKKQREGLALLVATTLDVRSVNLMELAAALPRAAERLDMRYQWISRLLGNTRIDVEAVMAPYAREVLARACAGSRALVVIIDQSKVNDAHHMVMVSLRVGERALPLAWRVKKTHGAIGFREQRDALAAVAALLPEGVRPTLMGDRFYGSPALIAWCRDHGWGWRLRCKQDLRVFDHNGGETTLAECFARGEHRLEDVALTGKRARTHVAMVHAEGQAEPWPSPGSSPCPSVRRQGVRATTACAGALRRCSRISRPEGSIWRPARSSGPIGSTGLSWSSRWRSIGRFQPECGTPPKTEPPSKKSGGSAPQECRPQLDVAVQAWSAADPLLPSAPHPSATSLGSLEK
jgi:hypothetical protein